MRRGTIVIADDEERQREALGRALRTEGHEVHIARGGAEAVELCRSKPVDLVLTDLRMPDLSGLDVLRQARAIQPEIAVVVMTAFGSVANAVEAMKAGAADYLTKPVELEELAVVVDRALERRDLVRENRLLRHRLEITAGGLRLVGRARSLQEVIARAGRAAGTDAGILIRGESGTGKELLARTIHGSSRRADQPFVAVNCAAFPETLIESEIFGHERGAFTGAAGLHRGRIELAEHGTLFLDEVGDLPAPMQVKLLRFLQDHEFTRLGGEVQLHADVRIIAATHRDLEELIRKERFREDLYYRLNVVTLHLPPLRDRAEDVPELVEHFLSIQARRHGLPVRGLTRDAMDALMAYEFPGNIRELENALEQATVLATGELLALEDLPDAIRRAVAGHGAGARRAPDAQGLVARMDEIERRIVLAVLARHDGNQSSAARELAVTEGGLRYKLRKWAQGDVAAGGGDAEPGLKS